MRRKIAPLNRFVQAVAIGVIWIHGSSAQTSSLTIHQEADLNFQISTNALCGDPNVRVSLQFLDRENGLENSPFRALDVNDDRAKLDTDGKPYQVALIRAVAVLPSKDQLFSSSKIISIDGLHQIFPKANFQSLSQNSYRMTIPILGGFSHVTSDITFNFMTSDEMARTDHKTKSLLEIFTEPSLGSPVSAMLQAGSHYQLNKDSNHHPMASSNGLTQFYVSPCGTVVVVEQLSFITQQGWRDAKAGGLSFISPEKVIRREMLDKLALLFHNLSQFKDL